MGKRSIRFYILLSHVVQGSRGGHCRAASRPLVQVGGEVQRSLQGEQSRAAASEREFNELDGTRLRPSTTRRSTLIGKL